MKKIILLIAATVLILPAKVSGQNMDDALRYSKLFYQGSARFNAMGGAFTALGGDISSIALNPAGAGVFRSTEFTLTPLFLYRNMNTDYNGFVSDNSYSSLKLGQIGVVSSFSTGKSSGLLNLNLAYSFNRTNNYARHSVIDGISDNGSMTDFWALQSSGYTIDELDGAPWMAYEAFLTEPLSGYTDEYASIFSGYGYEDPIYGQQVKRTIDNDGYSNEHTLALGANLNDKVYLGAGFGITNISYSGHYVHREIDVAERVYDFVNFTYTDHFDAYGSGWNFKIGAIIRPVESLRLGFSFTTPTVYAIEEVFYSSLTAKLDYDTPTDLTDDANPQITMNELSNRYRITTPLHINAGIAYQLGNFALISADYEYINYASARLSNGFEGYNFQTENDELKAEMGNVGNLRLGAELRMGATYLRGGYSHYGSPFQEGTLNEEADANGYSAGIGYRQNKFYVDMSMVWLNSYEAYMMYPGDTGTTPLYNSDPVHFNTKDSYLALTVGLKF